MVEALQLKGLKELEPEDYLVEEVAEAGKDDTEEQA